MKCGEVRRQDAQCVCDLGERRAGAMLLVELVEGDYLGGQNAGDRMLEDLL